MSDKTEWSTRARDLAVGAAAVIGSIAIPWATLENGKSQHDQVLARQYVELGVEILKSPKSEGTPDLTDWAVSIVNRYGDVPLSAEAVSQLREIRVPIPVRCAADPGPRPNYPDTEAALRDAPDIAERVKLIMAGRLLRQAREMELEAAISGCK
ncbi:MAG: hypothetical protein U1C74_25505 [Phenylobacterium sp.]|nr:hypothetical protein [Phenylobacterium sp.]